MKCLLISSIGFAVWYVAKTTSTLHSSCPERCLPIVSIFTVLWSFFCFFGFFLYMISIFLDICWVLGIAVPQHLPQFSSTLPVFSSFFPGFSCFFPFASIFPVFSCFFPGFCSTFPGFCSTFPFTSIFPVVSSISP